MAGYVADIEKKTKENMSFRKVLFTGPNSQLVVMSLKPGEEIGKEVHDVDQFFRIEEGAGKVVIGGEEHVIEDNWAAVVPGGTSHNVINTSPDKDLKLYTIYSPAQHPEGTVHATREEAMAVEGRH